MRRTVIDLIFRILDIPEIGDCQRELAEWREVMKKIDEEQEKKKKIFVERQLFTQEFHSQAVKDYQILDETTKITSAMTPGKRNPLTNVNPFSRADASPFLPPSLSQFGSGQKRRQKLILSSANMPEIQFADENVKPKPK